MNIWRIHTVALLLFLLTGTMNFICAQQDSILVDAKVWSRDAKRRIQYSEWKKFPSYTIDRLNGFKPDGVQQKDRYGGMLSVSYPKTGFFYTYQQPGTGRWWLVSPEGHPMLIIGMTSTRQGKSENSEEAFHSLFGSELKWAQETRALLFDLGFNMAGSWSDWETFLVYNKNNPQAPMPYCTQLNLLSGYAGSRRKEAGPAAYPDLARVFDPGFSNYCFQKLKAFKSCFNDSNLVGHFTDNELSFQSNLLAEFLAIQNPADPAFEFANHWIKEKGIDSANISRDQSDRFSGEVALKYYMVTGSVLKTLDPNHLNLGSRLHASAKNNPHILAAATSWLDMISINYYGNWAPTTAHLNQWAALNKPYFITEFYTKGEDAGMPNISGAGWLVRTQSDRGVHYQNFCLSLLQARNCIGWHWFRYQDNDPTDKSADPSNNDSNKGIVTARYQLHSPLTDSMRRFNNQVYHLIEYFEKTR